MTIKRLTGVELLPYSYVAFRPCESDRHAPRVVKQGFTKSWTRRSTGCEGTRGRKRSKGCTKVGSTGDSQVDATGTWAIVHAKFGDSERMIIDEESARWRTHA